MRSIISTGCLSLLAFSLSACSWVGVLATEGPLLLTERRGLDSFTLVADLPENFGLSITGWYGPVDKTRLNCQVTNLYDNEQQARNLGKGFDIPINPEAKSTSRTIPLTYYVGACELRLGRVEMDIEGRYGEQIWQKTYIGSTLYLRAQLPDGEPDFDRNGIRQVNRYCTWLFGESKMRHKELNKSLSCEGEPTGYLDRAQLDGKTLRLMIELNPDEAPSSEQSWIKVQDGWKPCIPKAAGGKRCQQPISFRTFQMNGQTCTVYPGCTE